MLNSARLSQELRDGLWAEAANYVTNVENCLVTGSRTQSSWFLFYGKECPAIRNMRQFGELAILNNHAKRGFYSKLENHGLPALYLGHADNHAADVYCFLSLETRSIVRSRDVTWLNKTYASYKEIEGVVLTSDDDDELVDYITTGTTEATIVPQPQPQAVAPPVLGDNPFAPLANDADDDNEDTNPAPAEAEAAAAQPNNPRLAVELRQIEQNLVEVDVSQPRTPRSGREIGTNDTIEGALFTVVNWGKMFPDFALKSSDPTKLKPMEYRDNLEIPITFDEAWNHPCEFQRKLWREAIMAEHTKMANYKVWGKVKRSMIPNGRKCVKCKWVLDIKRNGVFRAQLVACGYSQTPGVDFQESYSPVVNDAIFRMLLVLQWALSLKGIIIDIETAFLNGELTEEIYMNAPEGLDAKEDECVLLEKAIYGLVQSAWMFYLKFKQVMVKLGFKPSECKPCLFSKKANGSTIYVVVYVEDCYVIGSDANLKDFIRDIQTEFKIKLQENPTDYL
jgi:Reverse transcriptase (RNA-dependent DNA polymerase)